MFNECPILTSFSCSLSYILCLTQSSCSQLFFVCFFFSFSCFHSHSNWYLLFILPLSRRIFILLAFFVSHSVCCPTHGHIFTESMAAAAEVCLSLSLALCLVNTLQS